MSDDIIVFKNERIEVVSHVEQPSDSDDEYFSEIDEPDTNACVTDIYSNEHRWDTHVNRAYRFRPDIWWCQIERFFSHE